METLIIFCKTTRASLAHPFWRLLNATFERPRIVEKRVKYASDVSQYVNRREGVDEIILIFDRSAMSFQDEVQKHVSCEIGKLHVTSKLQEGKRIKCFSLACLDRGSGEYLTQGVYFKKSRKKYKRPGQKAA